MMEAAQSLIDSLLHVDVRLQEIVGEYGTWTYAILFAIVFAETGLVVTPFLPGDSLLFAAGAIAAGGSLHPGLLLVLLAAAAILGDSVNYRIGVLVGTRVFSDDARVLKTEYLRRTERFYEKYGGKTIVIARFVPIVRTYAPFVAGASRMDYRRFLTYNVLGGLLWISLFVIGGFFFGRMPIVEENFGLVVVAIILLSVAPVAVEFVRARRRPSSP